MADSNDKELQEALAEFVGAFEVMFRYDWPYTKIMFGDEVEGTTFIEPGLEDESEDWGARGALLERYRRLQVTSYLLTSDPGPRFERCIEEAQAVLRKAADEWALGHPEQPPTKEILEQIIRIFEREKFSDEVLGRWEVSMSNHARRTRPSRPGCKSNALVCWVHRRRIGYNRRYTTPIERVSLFRDTE